MEIRNQLQLVTHEQAMRLKAAGFDWITPMKCKDGFYFPNLHVALALKWARVVRGVYARVTFTSCNENIKYFYHINNTCGFAEDYDTYEEAESALLEAVLSKIEKKEV